MNPGASESVEQAIALSLDLFVGLARTALGQEVLPVEIGAIQQVDVAAARKAIDAADALFRVIEYELDEEDRSRVRALLTELRIEAAKRTDTSIRRDA